MDEFKIPKENVNFGNEEFDFYVDVGMNAYDFFINFIQNNGEKVGMGANFLDYIFPQGGVPRWLNNRIKKQIEDGTLRNFFAKEIIGEIINIRRRFGKGKNETKADILKGHKLTNIIGSIIIVKAFEKLGITDYLVEKNYKDFFRNKGDVEILLIALVLGGMTAWTKGNLGVKVGGQAGPWGALVGGAIGGGYGGYVMYTTYSHLKKLQKNLKKQGKEFNLIEILEDLYNQDLSWIKREDEFKDEDFNEIKDKYETLNENVKYMFENAEPILKDEKGNKMGYKEAIDKYINEKIILNPELNAREKKDEMAKYKVIQNCGWFKCEEDTYAMYENIFEKEKELNKDANEIEIDKIVEKELQFQKIKAEEERIKNIIDIIKIGGDPEGYSGPARFELLRLREEWNNLEYHIDKDLELLFNPNN